MASVIIGDYEYGSIGSNVASARVVNQAKRSYGPIESSVIIDGVTYTVRQLDRCFQDCTSLEEPPTIPETITSMFQCFTNCTSLTQPPTIPNSVTGDLAMVSCFYGCTSLTQAPVIPNGVTGLEDCFRDCTSLTQAPIIPSSVTDMSWCFCGCTSLTQAPAIPSSVTNMRWCFRDCTSLTQAPAIPSSVTDMRRCFQGCTSLTQAPAISSGVTDMNMSWCFQDCTSLTQAPVIPSGVTNMYWCFCGCISLTQAPVIPSNVTNMDYCFAGCRSLMQAPIFATPSNVTNMDSCFIGCTSLTQPPEIPSSVTNMSNCFRNCNKLTQAPEIPSSVTNMNSCFLNCYELKGNINIHSKLIYFDNIFDNTTQNIFLINKTLPRDWTILETIASQYSNVHLEAQDHIAPTVFFEANRTDENGKRSSTGMYITFTRQYDYNSDNLPEGWTTTFSESILLDGRPLIPVPAPGEPKEFITLTIKSDELAHSFTYSVSDGYKTTTMTSIKVSRMMALLDFYGNPSNKKYQNDIPGMGMAIGNISTRNGLDIQLPTTIGKGLTPVLGNNQVDLDVQQLIIGQYNNPNRNFIFIAGNGKNENNRSNAFTIDWNGIISARDKNNRFSDIFDLLYPIGSAYSTIDPNFDPNDSWGGTWEKLPEGYVLLSGSESGSYIVGDDTSTSSGYKEYGSNTHTLLEEEMPAHAHGLNNHTHSVQRALGVSGTGTWTGEQGGALSGSTGKYAYTQVSGTTIQTITATGGNSNNTTSKGGGKAHSIMQKSIAVYWWIRTA